MPRMRLALIATIGAVVLLTSCSSSNDSTPTTTTSTAVSTTAPPTSTPLTTAASPSTPPPTTAATAVRIVTLKGPRSPVSCNAPTSVEVHFETRNAESVTLRINGDEVFATYSNGKHDELVPLTCDGTSQKYLFSARGANGTTVTKTLTIETRMLATS